jgi:uncharacterized protein (TIGR00725 family)
MHVLIAVIGSSEGPRAVLDAAFETGREIMEAGYSLICGGMGGVMEAACRGAHSVVGERSGRIIGIIPGSDKNEANPFADIVIATGIGYARNSIIASSADAVIAVSGGSGTFPSPGSTANRSLLFRACLELRQLSSAGLSMTGGTIIYWEQMIRATRSPSSEEFSTHHREVSAAFRA